MPLSEVDRQFLIKLKEQGYNKDQAVAELKKIKISQTPNLSGELQNLKTAGVPDLVTERVAAAGIESGNPGLTNFGKIEAPQEKSGLQSAVDFVSTAGIKGGKAVAVDLPKNLLKFVTPKAGGIEEFVTKPFEAASQGLDKMIQGSQNYSQAGEVTGEVLGGVASALIPAGAGSKIATLGKGVKVGSGLGGVVKAAPAFAASSVGGTVGAEAALSGELPTAGEAGAGLGIDAALSSILKVPGAGKYLKNTFFTKAVDKSLDDVLKIAENKGIPKNQLAVVKDQVKQNPQMVDNLAAAATKYSESLLTPGGKAPQALDVVGDKLKSAQRQLIGEQTQSGSKLAEIGEQIGQEIDNLPTTKKSINLNTKPIYQNVKAELKKAFNITKFDKNGNPIFKGSSISKSPEDQRVIMQIWDDIKPKQLKNGKLQFPSFDPRTALATSDSLDNLIYTSSKDLTQSKGLAKVVSDYFDNAVADLSPKLKELQKEYSDLKGLRKDLLAKIQKDGVNSPEALSRLWGSADSVYNDLFTRVQNFSQKYGIEEGKNLIPESAVAVAFDNAAGAPPRSIGPAINNVTDAAAMIANPKVGVPSRILNVAGEALNDFRGLPKSKLDALNLLADVVKNNQLSQTQANQLSQIVDYLNTINADPAIMQIMRATIQSLVTNEDQ